MNYAKKRNEMFRQSKQKIVATIMSLLVLILAGTLGMIYGTTYLDVYRSNQSMLENFTNSNIERGVMVPKTDEDRLLDGPVNVDGRQSVVFYGGIFKEDGTVETVLNDLKPIMDDDSLVQVLQNIMELGRKQGKYENFIYRVTSTNDRIYVVLLDNTIVKDSMTSLVKNTAIFGCIVLFVLFGVSMYLAERIVHPLEEGYQKQKQFISDAGHELKTPISTINANSELLAREIGQNQWLSNIQYENHRMKDLVQQLLDLAKTENVALILETIDLSRTVMGGILPFESIAFDQGYTIESDISDGIILEGDTKQIGQLVSTLVDNAITHASGGGNIVVTLKKEHNIITFSVANPGIEIPVEEQERIFERFYRTDEARNQTGHYGLGLAIAKAIVLAHHGKITVKCSQGMTTFQATFLQK